MTTHGAARLLALALLAGGLLVACDGGGSSAEQPNAENSPATEPEASAAKPEPRARVCFRAKAVQVLGGKSLAALDQAREGTAPAVQVNLDSVVAEAFAPSLRLELGRLRRSGERAGPVLAAARRAMGSVEERPNVLLQERALGRLFRKAQVRAEARGYSSPHCDV